MAGSLVDPAIRRFDRSGWDTTVTPTLAAGLSGVAARVPSSPRRVTCGQAGLFISSRERP